jgi:uroporphyrin-III C-methyltransferase/precorrin-2 dehydrogenase/sirohydrochlorin ferrochelatase
MWCSTIAWCRRRSCSASARTPTRIHVGKERDEPHTAAGTDQHDAGAPGAGRQAGAAPEGRRPVHLRPWRRGDRTPGEARHSFPGSAGITAASGCACYAGIPLTHRDCSQSVRFVAGHLKNDSLDLDWPELAKENQTVVFYMGLMGLEMICAQLIAHGMPDTMPIALVQQGTTPNQSAAGLVPGWRAGCGAGSVSGCWCYTDAPLATPGGWRKLILVREEELQ